MSSHPPRPPLANAELVRKLARISPLYKSLECALNDILEDEGTISIHRTNHNEVTEEDLSSLDTRTSCIQFDEDIKQRLLERYEKSVTEILWDYDLNTTVGNNIEEQREDLQMERPMIRKDDYPPAALIRGKLEYYNRIGGQWRIVVSDAELRPRINFTKEELKKRNRPSLWEHSGDYLLSSQEQKLPHVVTDSSDSCLGTKFDGKLLILAYDDN